MRHLLFPLLLLGLATGILAGGCGEELPSSSVTSEGYPRVVLAELLTTTWCGWCPTAEEAMDRLFDEEGPEKLAVIHWHPSYGQGDPYAISEADVRTEIYEIFVGDPPGFPVCVYDGVAYFRGGWSGLYDDYRNRYEEEAALGSALQILLDPEISGNSAEIGLEILTQATLDGGTYDLVVAAVEHHAAEGSRTTSYVARSAVTEDINLHADHTHFYTVELALEPDWKREDLWIVAFVQQQPTGESSLREVLQAAMVPLIAAEEDFHAFVLSAPDTTISVASSGEREFPLSIQNTGTLDDTVTVDLPTALTSVPAGWTVGLRTSDGAEIVTPSSSPIGAGERIDALRLRIAADSAGSGTVGITCASGGDPALVDTLTFHVSAGSFGVALQTDDTDLDVLVGAAYLASFTITNSGTVEDSITIDLPDSLWSVPDGWKISLTDFGGTQIAQPLAIELGPGAENADLRLRVLATGQGDASACLTAVSQGNPLQTQTLEFTIAAHTYNFDLSTESPELQIVVGTAAVAPFEITNTGSRDDLLIIDLPDDPTLPEDWETVLVYGEQTEVTTPHPLLLEQGEAATGFGVRISAGSSGAAAVHLVVSSSGDPSLMDTLTFQVSADEYGLALRAPQGATISLSPGAATLIAFELENTGTLDDTFVLDLPAAGLDVPAGWEVSLTDAQENALAIPLEVSLVAGAVLDTIFIRALAPEGGSGSVELTAASVGLPSLGETLTFDLSASLYGFEIRTETEVTFEAPENVEVPFEIVNTGSLDDVLTIVAPFDLQVRPPDWNPATICDESQCYGPLPIDVEIAAGASNTDFHIGWIIHSPGVGTMKLIVASQGDSALADTLTFTFTSAKGLAPTGTSPLLPPGMRSSKPMAILPVARSTR